MRSYSLYLLSIFVLSAAVTAHAEAVQPASIPEKVSQNILKRHPNAQDMQASHETHFGQKLLEVSFKDEAGQPLMELFTANGHLFTNELLIEDLNEIYPAVIAALKKEFPQHEIKRAELIANPYSVGEEYEIYLHADGKDWKVSITDQGVFQDKQPANQ